MNDPLKVIEENHELQGVPARERIVSLQDAVSKLPGAQFGDSDLCPLKHSFAPGVYVREIFIPKDTIIIGKIHKHSHPNFLMSGKVTVITEGKGRETLTAPLSIISPSGTKRAVYAHEDTVWITVHVTEETDLEKIEDHVIAKSFEEYDKFIEDQKEKVKLCPGDL